MRNTDEREYITSIFKKVLEKEPVSADLMSKRLSRIESTLRRRIDVVLRQLSMLQREEKDLEDMVFLN